MFAVLLIVLGSIYFALQCSRVQTYLTNLFAKQLSEQLNSKISIGKVDFAFFNKIILEDVLVEDQKADTLFYAEHISGEIDSLKRKHNFVAVERLSFKNSKINIARDSVGKFNFQYILDALKTKKDTSVIWQINCKQFAFNQSKIAFSDFPSEGKNTFFLNNFNFNISNFSQHADSLQFKINELNLNDGKNLVLKHLSANFISNNSKISIKNLNLESSRSKLNNSSVEFAFGTSKPVSIENTNIDFRFSNSKISFYEIAELAPALKGMDLVVNCSGHIHGNLDDLKGKNLVVKTGTNTSAFLDFYANGLSNTETMFLFIDLKRSKTSFSDISAIKLPRKSRLRNLVFPESFYEAGPISYQGNFTGFLSDFVAFGTFSNKMGTLTTDISVIPDESGSIIYRGVVSTSEFQMGELFQNKTIGEISFDGEVDGNYDKKTQSFYSLFDGKISKLEANNYTYKNIELLGHLDKKMFDGSLQIDDPNLKFDFNGKVDLNSEVPEFNFKLDLQKALPGNLGLSTNYPNSQLAFNLMANFSGNKIDNLEGNIDLYEGIYKNKNGELDLKGIKLVSTPELSSNKLAFNSTFFDVDIDGIYNFQSIISGFKKVINNYLPAINFAIPPNYSKNRFDYHINVKNLEQFTKVFIPEYKIETPFLLYGKIDTDNSIFELQGSIPGVSSEKILVKNIFIANKPVKNSFTSKFRLGEILLNNGMTLYNLSVNSKIAENVIDNQISWTNYHDLTYSGVIKTQSVFSNNNSTPLPHIAIEGKPTKIFIADSVWNISPFTATIDSSSIGINNLRFFNREQNISINGKISEKKSEQLSLSFQNINLDNLRTYLNSKIDVKGILNGSIGVFDFYGQRIIYSDVLANNFEFKNQKFGDISLTNQWDQNKSALNSELKIIKNNRQSLLAKGYYQPGSNALNYNVELDHLSLVVLETVMRKNFSNFHGDGSGKIKIHGTPKKLLLTGALEGSNAGLTIDYTQVSYHFNDTVYFKGDTIHFDKIKVSDVSNNSGIFDGTITHQSFRNMVYDLNISTPKIMALNTSPKNNEQFFGQVVATGSMDITGQGRQVDMTGSATTLSGTNVNISLDYESEIEQYDFIKFVSTQETENQEFLFPQKKNAEITLNLAIKATPEAKAQLIYNSNIGDVIKAQGEGILLFGMDKEGAITLSGDYIVERGDYLFTLQNVINKRFSIEQGGTLVWSGNPYNAIVDLHAVYKLKASLYDLLVNSYQDIYQSQRIPVECKILLSDELSNPLINFEIDFPTSEDRIIDEVQQYFNTDEEMNKQILSLLVLGKFYTPEYMRGTYDAQNSNVIGTTASELFSNQLSNWLSQISNNVDIGLNYRPGNEITNDEIELALSTQMFNDRVTINGNIGNNVNPNSSNNQLVGDFDINVKLNPSGKIQFKAYNRSNNNLIYETAPYTQGIGLTFKEEYNTFGELLQKFSSLFKRKKRNNK